MQQIKCSYGKLYKAIEYVFRSNVQKTNISVKKDYMIMRSYDDCLYTEAKIKCDVLKENSLSEFVVDTSRLFDVMETIQSISNDLTITLLNDGMIIETDDYFAKISKTTDESDKLYPVYIDSDVRFAKISTSGLYRIVSMSLIYRGFGMLCNENELIIYASPNTPPETDDFIIKRISLTSSTSEPWHVFINDSEYIHKLYDVASASKEISETINVKEFLGGLVFEYEEEDLRLRWMII